MAELQLTPALRFPEFENTWQTLTLEKMSSRIGDGIHGTPQYDEEGAYYFVNGNNLSNGRIEITETTKKVSEEEQQKHYRELNDRTILMSINGTIGNLAYYNNEPVMLGKSAAYINLLPDYEISYVFNYLSTRKIQAFFHSELTGSTIKNLSLRTIRETKLHLPTDATEQKKIASFLTAVDQRIQLLQKKKAKLEEYKKGVMKKLFSQEIRFRDENGNDFPDWEEKKLNEIIIRTSTGLNPRKNFKLGKGNNFYVTIKNITNGKIDFSTCELIDDEALELISKRSDLSKDDIIMSSIGNIGESYLLKEAPVNWNINESVFMIRPNQKKVLPIFLYYILTGEYALRYFEGNMTGSSFKSIKIGDLKIMPCAVPSLKEQIKIADFLTSLDESIESLDKEIEGTTTFKKGLLQKMFV